MLIEWIRKDGQQLQTKHQLKPYYDFHKGQWMTYRRPFLFAPIFASEPGSADEEPAATQVLDLYIYLMVSQLGDETQMATP